MGAQIEKDRAKNSLSRTDLEGLSGAQVRQVIREGRWTGTSKRHALGREQANVVILREQYALDFMRFCQRNPKPLFLIEVTNTGDPEPKMSAPGADIRTDVAAYRVYRNGKATEDLADIRHLWRDDHVAFLTGCNLSVDQVMIEAKIPLPHLISETGWPSQYVSNIACQPAGIFSGPLVVSMRPIQKDLLVTVIELSSRFPRSHGAPNRENLSEPWFASCKLTTLSNIPASLGRAPSTRGGRWLQHRLPKSCSTFRPHRPRAV